MSSTAFSLSLCPEDLFEPDEEDREEGEEDVAAADGRLVATRGISTISSSPSECLTVILGLVKSSICSINSSLGVCSLIIRGAGCSGDPGGRGDLAGEDAEAIDLSPASGPREEISG